MPKLFLWLGQPTEVAGLAQAYFNIAIWGLFPALGIMALRSYLSALEHTQVVLWVTLIAALINAALNYLLIFGHFGFPELGERGAAIASVATHLAGFAGLVIYARWRLPAYQIFVRLWKPDWQALRQVCRLGWQIGLTSLAEVGLFSASSVIMGWVGTVEQAAHGIALQISFAVFTIHLGLSQAATVRAGRAYGRRDPLHLRRAALAVMCLSGGLAAVTMLAFFLFPEPLVRPFLDPAEPQLPAILSVAVQLLAVAGVFQLVDAMQVIGLGVLRGAQDTRVPMIFAALSYWGIGAPVAYLLALPLGLGAIGVWIGLLLGLSAAGLLMQYRFWCKTLPRVGATAPATPLKAI